MNYFNFKKTKHINNDQSYTDSELLVLLKKSDPNAFARIYDKYSRELFAYAITLVKLHDLAENAVQDVFIRLWDARTKINIETSFRSYLFRACHNRACDINKEISKNQHLLEELAHYYQSDDSPGEELSEQAKDYIQLLENALNELTPQRRRIYEMCKEKKKSYVEVAHELGISPNTVKNHMAQILDILRKYFRSHSTAFWVIFILLEKVL